MPINFYDVLKTSGFDQEGHRLVRGKDLDITATGGCDQNVATHTDLASCDAGAADHDPSSTGHWVTQNIATLADADLFLVDDGGQGLQSSTKQLAASKIKTYVASQSVTIYSQNDPPNGSSATPPVKAGDLWIDTNDSNKLYVALTDGSNSIDTNEWTFMAITDTNTMGAGFSVAATTTGTGTTITEGETLTLTAGAGISTTGTSDGVVTIATDFSSSTTGEPVVELKNLTNDATSATLKFTNERTGGVGANNDRAGIIEFYAEDDAGNSTNVGKITASITDVTDGSEDGNVLIEALGGTTSEIRLDSGGIVKLDAANTNDTFGVQFALNGTTVGDVTGHHAKTYFTLYENIGASTADKFYISCAASGATEIATVDAAGTGGDISIVPDGSLRLDPETSLQVHKSIHLLEQASASADQTGYGQIWVTDTNPPDLAFTDDAGTDIIGIGKYHYETKIANFANTGGGPFYLPIAGYVVEKTSITGANEFVSMIAPFSGTLEKFVFRSEIQQGTGSGTMSFFVYESSDGTELPGSVLFRKDLSGLNIAKNVYTEYDLTSPSVGSFPIPITKGKIYAFAWTPAAGPHDTNITLVFKWNTTS